MNLNDLEEKITFLPKFYHIFVGDQVHEKKPEFYSLYFPNKFEHFFLFFVLLKLYRLRGIAIYSPLNLPLTGMQVVLKRQTSHQCDVSSRIWDTKGNFGGIISKSKILLYAEVFSIKWFYLNVVKFKNKGLSSG